MPDSSFPPLEKLDPAEAWAPWQPDAKNPWTTKWAGHLYRRALFGATWSELRAAVQDGLPATLEQILHGDLKNEKIEYTLKIVGDTIAGKDNIVEMRSWWLYAMLHSFHPLREKMTLFWHNHFATSFAKVQRADLMYKQNQLLRQHALGNFRPFLLDISRDPAMLLWLDSNSNIKGKPNENYAREVMELFSLGVGHYTEKDVREAARAFTGWHTDGQKFAFNSSLHDGDEKTVLDHQGNWDGGDVIRIMLEQPSAAQFLVGKLYRFFISETAKPPASLLEPLADSFRKSDYDIAGVVKTILQSRHFFSDHAYRQRLKSPVEFALGAIRAAWNVKKGVAPGPIPSHLEAMGQDLFAPPNVKGWVGGRAWLNTATVLARNNFAQMVASGLMFSVNDGRRRGAFRFVGRPPKPTNDKEDPDPDANSDAAAIVQEEKITAPEKIVDLLVDLLLQGGIDQSARTKLTANLAGAQGDAKSLHRRIRETVHAIMTMPEYQLA